MKIKNSEINLMLHQLRPVLSNRNKVGYVAARNYRILSDALIEYNQFKNDLIKEYGSETTDENGDITIGIKIDGPNFRTFCEKLQPINNVEQDISLIKAKYEDVIDVLSGEEILAIDWMLEE